MPYPLDTLSTGGLYLNPSDNPYNYSKWEFVSRNIASAWLTLEDLRAQLNLYGNTTQDTYLTDLELAVRFAIENYLGRWIFDTNFRSYYPADQVAAPPAGLDIPLVHSNASIDGVFYYDQTNMRQMLPTTSFFYDPTGNKVVLTGGISPSIVQTAPVEVEYTAPAEAIATYPDVKHAGKMLVTHFYNSRSAYDERQLKAVPFGIDALLMPYKDLVL